MGITHPQRGKEMVSEKQFVVEVQPKPRVNVAPGMVFEGGSQDGVGAWEACCALSWHTLGN